MLKLLSVNEGIGPRQMGQPRYQQYWYETQASSRNANSSHCEWDFRRDNDLIGDSNVSAQAESGRFMLLSSVETKDQ